MVEVKYKFRAVRVVWGLILTAVGIFLGVFLYKTLFSRRLNPSVPIDIAPHITMLPPSPTLQASATSVTLSQNWSTYTATSGYYLQAGGYTGYSFRYPTDWDLDQTSMVLTFQIKGEMVKIFVDGGGFGEPDVAEKYKSLVVNQAKQYPGGLVLLNQMMRKDNSQVQAMYDFVNDLKGSGGSYFSFIAWYPLKVRGEFNQLFDQVLSTIRFTK